MEGGEEEEQGGGKDEEEAPATDDRPTWNLDGEKRSGCYFTVEHSKTVWWD